MPIVERGQRFHGLTPDGQRVLHWANAILEHWASLQQEIAAPAQHVGRADRAPLIGVIPSGLPMAALISKAIQRQHPGIELTVLSQSSIEILRNLEDFSIDVGLTYLDNEPIEGMRAEADLSRSATACSFARTIPAGRAHRRSRGKMRPRNHSAC